MPGNNLFMNFSGVTVTPTDPSGAAIAIGEITDVEIDGKSVQQAFYGDARKFARLVTNTQKSRTITLKGGNAKKFMEIPEDAECTIVAILQDPRNGVGSGALTITAIRGVMDGKMVKAPNNQYATTDVKFMCAGSIGVGAADDVDPISIVQAS